MLCGARDPINCKIDSTVYSDVHLPKSVFICNCSWAFNGFATLRFDKAGSIATIHQSATERRSRGPCSSYIDEITSSSSSAVNVRLNALPGSVDVLSSDYYSESG